MSGRNRKNAYVTATPSFAAHLSRQAHEVGLVPMLDELAISDAPDLDVSPGQLLSRRREQRRVRSELHGMTMDSGQCDPGDDFVAAENAILDLHVKVTKGFEILAHGGLQS